MGQIVPPGWNTLPIAAAIAGSPGSSLAIPSLSYCGSPWYADTGGRPVQPDPDSYTCHVGEPDPDGRSMRRDLDLMLRLDRASMIRFLAAGAPAGSQLREVL